MIRTAMPGAIAAALAAQAPVCVSGIVEPVPGPTICQNGETHWFAAASVYLRSSTVNLAALVGHTVQVQGTDVGLLCHVIDVQQVADPAPVAMSSCGSPMLGCPVRLRVSGPGLGFAVLAGSVARAFQPLGCSGPGPTGTILLGPPIVTLVSGTTGLGTIDVLVPIPPNPALQGVSVWFQGAHMTIGPIGPIVTSDVVRIVVTPLLPPCAPTNC